MTGQRAPEAFFAPLDPGQTPLDPNEIAGLRLDISTRAELNDAEELNVLEGVRWGTRVVRRRDPLDSIFARELHRRLFGRVWSWAGTFRSTARNIGVDADQISVCAEQLVANARHWIAHETFDPDELFARFHHRLVEVHCFPNGNGRHARVLTDLVMVKHGIAPFGWGQSLAREISRQTYIESLRAADAGDLKPLIAFVRR
jgi:Fic-DOC domain mobile mystery protein B